MREPLLEPTPVTDTNVHDRGWRFVMLFLASNWLSLINGPLSILVSQADSRNTYTCPTESYQIWLIPHGIFLMLRFVSYVAYYWFDQNIKAMWCTVFLQVINFVLFIVGTVLFWTDINRTGCPHNTLWQFAQWDSVLYLVYYIFTILRTSRQMYVVTPRTAVQIAQLWL